MPQIGDLFVKLGRGETLTPGELETLRLEMNRVQSAASRVDTIMAPTGGLDPNIFCNSGGFSVLPHEVASLRFDTQAIANNTTTTPVTLAASSSNRATWNYGFKIDVPNSRIYTTGRPGDMVLLICAWWQWASDNDGIRKINWTTDDGGAVSDIRPSVQDMGMYQYISHIRRVAAAETYHSLSVFHTAGANLNGDGLLAIYRLH